MVRVVVLVRVMDSFGVMVTVRELGLGLGFM